MIGQKQFFHYLQHWKQPPQFLILQGEDGSGRSTLIEVIKSHFKYDTVLCGSSVEEIRSIISLAYHLSKPTFYIFYNGDSLSISAKNTLLKIVEEPPKAAHFILRTSNNILETLQNRAFVYKMQSYTADELHQGFKLFDQEGLYDSHKFVCKNIGQIKKFLKAPYEDMIAYCDNIVNIISTVAAGNILNITNKLALKEEVEKWDITTFLNILEWQLCLKYQQTKDDKFFQGLYRLHVVQEQLKIVGVNKQMLFDNFFLGLKDLL